MRALEKQLGLSKNTAQAAYDELVARGLVEAREREGVNGFRISYAFLAEDALRRALTILADALRSLRR